MSIFLKAVQRTNPQDPEAPKWWFPVQYTTKMWTKTKWQC